MQLEHAKAWVPAQLDRLAVRSSLQFRDGLLDGCSLLPMSPADARELSREPLWAAVRHLDRAPIELVEQASSLERLTSVDLPLLQALWGRRGLLRKVRELGVRVARAPGLIDALLQVDLPALTTLSLKVVNQGLNPHQRQGLPECCEDCARPGPFEPAIALQPRALQALLEAPLGQQLKVLELHTGYVDLTSFIGGLEALRCDLDRVHLRPVERADGFVPGWVITLSRTAAGRYRRAQVAQLATHDDRFDLDTIIATAPPDLDLSPARLRKKR